MNNQDISHGAEAAYIKKRINFVKFGIFIAIVCSITFSLTSFLSVAAQGIISPFLTGDLISLFVNGLLTVAVMEMIAAIFLLIYNHFFRGMTLAEYGRTWGIKSSRWVILSSLCAGPIATGALFTASSLCGVTYAAAIVATSPILAAIGARFFLKEKLDRRVFIGIIIAVIGVVIANYAPPSTVDSGSFYLGVGIAILGSLGFAAEALLSTYALDISDPLICCGLYRTFFSSIMGFIIVFCICAFSDNVYMYKQVLSLIFSNFPNMTFIYLLWGGLVTCICYGTAYVAFGYCGAARSSALIYSMALWSIPVGLFFSAIGIFAYSVSTLGIIGAITIVAGVLLVIAKPSELFTLREI